MGETFNNTGLIKIRNTTNGLWLQYRSPNNEDCIIEEVIEHRDEGEECPLIYAQRVLHHLMHVLSLEYVIKYTDDPRHLEINIVKDSQDAD